MTAKAWLTDTEPSGTLPIYTRLNAGEVMPDPITPLGASLCWIPQVLPGWATAYVEDFVFLPEEVTDESAVAGLFYGDLYLNMSALRILAIRKGIPWQTADEVFFNAVDAPPHDERATDHNDFITAMAPARVAWALTATVYPDLEEDRLLAERLRTERPNLRALSNRGLVARARMVMPLHRLSWRGEHIGGVNGAAPRAVATSMLPPEKQHLVLRLIGAAGDVDSAAPSYALWALSRHVRADAELTALFDGGVDAVAERMHSGHGPFWSELEGFFETYGFRGPSEWDLGTPSWESQPQLVFALLERLRQMDDSQSPAARQIAQAAEIEAAMAEAVAGMDADTEAAFRNAIAAGRRFSSWRERGKGNCIKVLNEARMPLVELGRRLEASGSVESWHHVFMAVDSELDTLALDTGSLRQVLSDREAAWRELALLDVPTYLDASQPLPSIADLPRKGQANTSQATPGTVLTGATTSQGVVEGRARIVLRTDEIGDFEPGEILVAPQTDPSWTPLFMVAGGVITEVGSVVSHAMIVARELGIPCVAGVTDATRRIVNGSLVRVDGTTGSIEVLAGP
jgi:pyruvate,water dikinase